jgi:hypothetical protein
MNTVDDSTPTALAAGTPRITQGWQVILIGDAALDTTDCPAIEIVHDGADQEPLDHALPQAIRVASLYHSVGEAGELYFHTRPLARTNSAVLVLAPGTWASVVPLNGEEAARG